MIIYNTNINECVYTKNIRYDDGRGFFSELHKISDTFFDIKQINCSFSKAGVLRGIHRTPYAKFVSCVSGSVYDVCVDLRKNSATYLDHFGIELNTKNLYSLYIPPYCGHAFIALEDSVLIYYQTQEYDKNLDQTFCYKNFSISWPIEPTKISEKDSDSCA